MNLIQGKDAVLSFYKNSFLPFVCSSTVTIDLTGDELPIRTLGSGKWKGVTYQNLGYSISLSGVLVYDIANFSGWDMLENQLNFLHVQFRLSYTHGDGTVKSFQGYCMVKSTTFTSPVSDVVKDDFALTGNGELMYFDGFVPCPSTIATITVTGQTAADGIIHVTFTYTGAPYQAKYRVDNTGAYTYVAIGPTIDIPGLPIGGHSIEIIPVCQNNYEGTPLSQTFVITQNLTCALVISSITVAGTGPVTVSNNYTPLTAMSVNMKYRVDGGAWVITNLQNVIGLGGLTIGSHAIEEVPICSNGVEGTGLVQSFSVTTGSVSATINWSNAFIPGGTTLLSIYKNGVLIVNQVVTGSGTFTALNTDSIKAVLSVNFSGNRDTTLIVRDQTISVDLYNNFVITTPGSPSGMLQFTFSPTGGDTYLISGNITP